MGGGGKAQREKSREWNVCLARLGEREMYVFVSILPPFRRRVCVRVWRRQASVAPYRVCARERRDGEGFATHLEAHISSEGPRVPRRESSSLLTHAHRRKTRVWSNSLSLSLPPLSHTTTTQPLCDCEWSARACELATVRHGFTPQEGSVVTVHACSVRRASIVRASRVVEKRLVLGRDTSEASRGENKKMKKLAKGEEKEEREPILALPPRPPPALSLSSTTPTGRIKIFKPWFKGLFCPTHRSHTTGFDEKRKKSRLPLPPRTHLFGFCSFLPS